MLKIIRPRYLLVILILGLSTPGCSLLHKSSHRKSDKKLEQEDEKGKKAYEHARQQHLKNQSKQTVKMMKKTKRRSDKLNRGMQKNHSRKHC